MKTLLACLILGTSLLVGTALTSATTGGDFTDWGTYDDYGDSQLPPAVRHERAQISVLRDRYQRGTLSATALCAALAAPETLREFLAPPRLLQTLIDEQHIQCPAPRQDPVEPRGQM